jgi:hypothetical protein
MPVSSYLTTSELDSYISGTADSTTTVQGMLSSKLSGVESIPYQFMSTVDRRLSGTEIGRKYSEKITARMPLLFLTPCRPLFMDDFSKTDKNTGLISLIENTGEDTSSLINGSGRFYSTKFAYTEYYGYLNTMLTALIAYMGLTNETINIDGKGRKKLGSIDWSNDTNDDFKTFFSSKENLVFYLDGLSSVSESFSNSTTTSSLASTINGFSDTAKEVLFLFGGGDSVVSNLLSSATDVTSSITSSLSSVIGSLGGGILGSLSGNGVNTVLNGGKIVFPEIWSDSEYDKSYSIDIKLRSPDHDSLSIFMNVLKPYCKILALTLPQMLNDDPNNYSSPFLVRAYSKGMFNIDMGIITGLNVTKGAECCWNDDGLPTQIDISIDIKDLYSNLIMSSQSSKGVTSWDVANNTSYMDFLANMAGLNIAQMEIGRRLEMTYYLSKNSFTTIPSRIFTRFDQSISSLMGKLYEIL